MTMRITPIVLGLATVAATVLVAAPARADHRAPVTIVARGWGHQDNCRPSWRQVRSDAECDFDRGCEKGSERGFDAGYWDGRYGRRYCAEPTASFARVSCSFRDGYINGFTRSYAAGFEKGRCERACSQPRCR